ncbi:MAG: MBL fold metallo-hydrolase [Bacteroidota bacterium]
MVKITLSEKRNPVPQQIKLDDNITLTTWGAIKVNKAHFFPSSFQIMTGDKVIYIDPVEVDTSEKADYIFLTHSHPDHFSLKDIQKTTKPETIIVCSKGVAKKLKGIENSIQVIKPGDNLDLDGISCEATAAYNTKSILLWIKAHPKSKENVGFVLTLDNGLRIYHAGDTDYIPEMKHLKNIQVALIPIGGDNLTMNEDDAAQMVNEIMPEKVVPMHYEIKGLEKLTRFKTMVNPSVEIIEL